MSLVHGTGVDGATATGVNPVLIAGKDAAGNLDTLKVESGVVSTSVASALPAGTALLGKVGIDQTTPGVTNAVTLSGSIPEYGWVNGDTEPEPDRFAFGVKVDSTTGNITCMYWNGTAWKAVV